MYIRHSAGIRTYYLNRSQPPLYSEMVRMVWEATQDVSILRCALYVTCMRLIRHAWTQHMVWEATQDMSILRCVCHSMHNVAWQCMGIVSSTRAWVATHDVLIHRCADVHNAQLVQASSRMQFAE